MFSAQTLAGATQGSGACSPAIYPAHLYYTPLNILLVEDNPGDTLLTRKAIETTRVAHDIHALQRGNDVLPYLWRTRKKGADQMPDLIMLDLGLPGVDGFEVLSELGRAPASIRAVPILILTGYQEFKYVCKNYDLYFLAYLAKPCDSAVLRDILHTIRYNGSFS